MDDAARVDRIRVDLAAAGDRFDDAIDAVRKLGQAGEQLVLECLPRSRGYRRAALLWALGACASNAGAAALRTAARSGTTKEERAAALTALEECCGQAATQDFADALGDGDPDLREFAVFALAKHGDARAWEQVLSWLTEQLGKRKRPEASPCTAGVGVTYLVTHVASDRDRLVTVVQLLRARWDRLTADEVRWVRRYWPEAAPDGPDIAEISAPEIRRLRDWVNNPHLWTLDQREC